MDLNFAILLSSFENLQYWGQDYKKKTTVGILGVLKYS